MKSPKNTTYKKDLGEGVTQLFSVYLQQKNNNKRL